jgi:NADPH-dependent curcumin reductase CurA
VSKVVLSGHPDFKPGDLLWGVTGWEEYSLIPNPVFCHRINHHEFPLSYYTGVLGEFNTLLASCFKASTDAQIPKIH